MAQTVKTAKPGKPSGRRLVIVESPAKAKTIAGYLGKDYMVESSIGHIRDLPHNATEVPAEHKQEPWARLGVNVDHEFEPLYVVDPKKKSVVSDLKAKLKNADELLLATDEDREGEAIAWHLVQVLQPKVPIKRMVFHEITKPAIERALGETREIDDRLVDAQETRRILDRLYGYEVSPVLWRKVMKGLSAGRVQSVATRLVVERERERIEFRAAEYWDIVGTFVPGAFDARLTAVDGHRVAQGRDFARNGTLQTEGAVQLDENAVRSLAAALEAVEFAVRSVERKPYTRRPAAPFITSTLQQEASRKLRFTAQHTMRVAQRLYENGYITYMRTDSTSLAESAIAAARSAATTLYGADSIPDAPRHYTRKVKNAQEAHEAIRPAGDSFRAPDAVKAEVERDESALYDLIWKRTVASQMADARGETVSVKVGAVATDGRDAEFGTAGTVITFRGFMLAYEEGRDEAVAADEEERRLPPLTEGDTLNANALEPESHSTTPPARYTEPTLVRALEERGIGRPSTYASILGTILDRGYIRKVGQALVPTFLAFAVTNLLEQHFGRLVNYEFTALMEDDLDRIASGDEERTAWLRRFYFGGNPDDEGLKALVSDLADIDARQINTIEIGDGIELRVGRYGPYIERNGERVTISDEIAPDELTVAKAEELLSQKSDERELGINPETGRAVSVKSGRYGPYVTEAADDGEKPKTASLFKSMLPDAVTLEEVLPLLMLPRTVGVDPGTSEEIVVSNGKFGPFLKRGSDTRSLESEEMLLTISLDEALALLAEPKQHGRRAAAAPLKELGPDPVSGKPLLVKNGRFGPYVTDGETNASLRAGDAVETLSLERAVELMTARRERGPAAPKGRKKRS
ncbi:MAG TPA: type I DNA topoisomerase [Gaiellaceae bacterium]|jgi:DNA topoisomerase-1|nr:type I DNA topoisomerase [Gaiellaceae bacterium]